MSTYRIYHTGSNRSLRIERVPEVYPEGSLGAVLDPVNDTITVVAAPMGLKVLGPLSHTRYARGDGTTFLTHLDCMSYLDAEFSKKYEVSQIDWSSQEW